jgi:hypothetical protein
MGNEVENILNEIRERVHQDRRHDEAPASTSAGNSGGRQALSLDSNLNAGGELQHVNGESMNRLSAHLTTTSRAWDRLPPLNSNRRGGAARFELWIKARLKAMSRWFTWEQVNFNSAVHHALTETLHALSAYQQELAALRVELAKQAEASREGFERGNRELTTLRGSLEARTSQLSNESANLAARNTAIEARNATIEARSANIEARNVVIETRVAELAADVIRKIDEAQASLTPRLAELAGELRESDQQLREEQRVSFKQLSLEASEATVNEERGRRLLETRLDKLEKALSNGDQ